VLCDLFRKKLKLEIRRKTIATQEIRSQKQAQFQILNRSLIASTSFKHKRSCLTSTSGKHDGRLDVDFDFLHIRLDFQLLDNLEVIVIIRDQCVRASTSHNLSILLISFVSLKAVLESVVGRLR
jgi:hypothetical protein